MTTLEAPVASHELIPINTQVGRRTERRGWACRYCGDYWPDGLPPIADRLYVCPVPESDRPERHDHDSGRRR